MSEQTPQDSELQTPLPDQEVDLAPDADDPGDDQLDPEVADLHVEENPQTDEIDLKPDGSHLEEPGVAEGKNPE